LKLRFRLLVARISLAENQPEQAIAEIAAVQRQARQSGYAELDIESRLAQAEYLQQINRGPQADGILAGIEKASRLNGFGLLGRRAALLAKRT
jgi:hypothetical protein